MSRLASLILVFASLAPAQFYDLATTDDGSIVYFATGHRRVGTEDPFQGRIWAVDATGLRLVAARERRVVTPTGGFVTTFTNFYDLADVSVSGDGATLSFSGRRDCTLSSRCGGSEVLLSATVRAPSEIVQLDGEVQLSHNGQFALVHSVSHTGGTRRVVDLRSGETRPLSGSGGTENPTGRLIADDGSYVSKTGTFSLHRFDGSLVLEIQSTSAVETAIDAAATRIVFVERGIGGVGYELRSVNVTTQEQQTLYQSNTGIRNLVMDRAGTTAAFLARPAPGSPFGETRPQVFLANLGNGDIRPLPTAHSVSGASRYRVTERPPSRLASRENSCVSRRNREKPTCSYPAR